MQGQTEVRRVGVEAAKEVHAIMRRAFASTAEYAHPSSALREEVADVRGAIAAGGAVLLVSSSQAIASCRFHRKDDGLVIERLAVLPEHAGRGHGRRVVEWLVEYARRLGCTEVRANARSQMPDNRGFWTQLSFEVMGYSGRYGIPDIRTRLRRVL